MSASRTQASGDELLLAHIHVLSDDDRGGPTPESRLSDWIGPALAGLLMRALGRRGAPRRARRL